MSRGSAIALSFRTGRIATRRSIGAHRDLWSLGAAQSPGAKVVFSARAWVRHELRRQLAASQVKGVPNDQSIGFDAAQRADFDELAVQARCRRQNQRLLVGDVLDEMERRRDDVHLPV